jgi:hypothetical protein
MENVTLLRGGQERRLVDDRDRSLDDAGPHHLIAAEHDAVDETGVDHRLEISIKRRPRLRGDDDADVDVQLRMEPGMVAIGVPMASGGGP